ncbi:MAG: hypothetical protein HYW37_00285 [Candidatus Colwellbacteria bacterium]|nr:hypothetical protein [Candidatus Colwellbacteria bacterium]
MRDYRFRTQKGKTVFELIKPLLLVLLPFILIGGSFYLFKESRFFEVQAIEVRGLESLSKEAVLAALEPKILERSFLGKLLGIGNILAWQGNFSPDLRDEFPRLASLNVQGDLFRRSVVVNVAEKEKSVVWCLVSRDTCFWVDKEGVVFDLAPAVSGRIIKVVRDSSERDLNIGETVLPADEVSNLAKIFQFLSNLNLHSKEMKIENVKFKEITAILDEGPELRFSLNVDPGFGSSVVKTLIGSNDWSKIRYVDLRIEGRVYYSK